MDDPGTTLWSLTKDGREVACRVRLMPYGIEVDINRDGSTIVTRTFDAEDDALAWAQKKRADREAEGWV